MFYTLERRSLNQAETPSGPLLPFLSFPPLLPPLVTLFFLLPVFPKAICGTLRILTAESVAEQQQQMLNSRCIFSVLIYPARFRKQVHYRKLLRISWTKLITTEQVYILANTNKQLLSHVRCRKLQYFDHVMRQSHDSIVNTMMTGLAEGSRSRGRPKICWFDNIMSWMACWDPDCCTLQGTEGVGVLLLIHAADTVAQRRRRDDMTGHDMTMTHLMKVG